MSEVSAFCEFVGFTVCVFLGRGRNSVVGFWRLRVSTTDVTRGFHISWILTFFDLLSLWFLQVFSFLRFIGFLLLLLFVIFWILRFLVFLDFEIFSDVLVCAFPRFSESVIFQILRILRLLAFRIFAFRHCSMRGCFVFLIFWISRCSGCKGFRELWSSRFLGSWILRIIGFLPFLFSGLSG